MSCGTRTSNGIFGNWLLPYTTVGIPFASSNVFKFIASNSVRSVPSSNKGMRSISSDGSPSAGTVPADARDHLIRLLGLFRRDPNLPAALHDPGFGVIHGNRRQPCFHQQVADLFGVIARGFIR